MRSRSQCSSSRCRAGSATAATRSTSRPRLVGHLDDVERREHDRQRRRRACARSAGTPASRSSSARRASGSASVGCQQPRDRRVQRHRAGREVAHGRGDVERPRAGCAAASASRARPAGGPRAACRSARRRRISLSSASISPHCGRISKISRATAYARAISRGGRAGLLVQAEGERRAAAVEHVVHDLRGDDLAPQPVLAHLLAEALRQRRGEVALELGGQVGVLRHVGVEQLVVQVDLAVGEQHGQLRPRRARRGRACARRSPRRRAAPRARGRGSAPASRQRDEARVHVDHARRLRLGQAERLGLLVVVLAAPAPRRRPSSRRAACCAASRSGRRRRPRRRAGS